jgi:hypothetical protein
MTSRAEIMRERQILEYCQDNPSAASDINAALHIPYVSSRRLLLKLAEEGKLEEVDYAHGKGGYRYKTKSLDPMPYITSFGNNYPAIAYLNEMADRAALNGGRFTSDGISDATHLVALSLATLFNQAFEAMERGKIDEQQLRFARETLVKCEKTFAEMAKVARQILDNPTFWNETFLVALTRSGAWNSQHVKRNYDILTTKIQEVEGY